MLEIIKKALFVALIFLTIKYGTLGLALGWAVSSFFTLLLTLFLSKRVFEYSIIDLIKDIYPYFILSLVLSAAAYFLSIQITNNFLYLGFCIGFVGGLYILFCRLFKLEASNEMFDWLDRKILRKIKLK